MSGTVRDQVRDCWRASGLPQDHIARLFATAAKDAYRR